MDNPLKYFSVLTDPRVERNREHLLEEILLIAIAAVLSGAESWNDKAEYGEHKLDWLETFLTLPGGIPSHDTFNRVFAALDLEEMEKGFEAWEPGAKLRPSVRQRSDLETFNPPFRHPTRRHNGS